MNVLMNLIELYNHLPSESTYKETIHLILANLNEAADASIYTLSDITGSSRSTIKRLLDRLGYKNYSEFHEALRLAVNNYTYYNRILPRTIPETDIVPTILNEVRQTSDIRSADLAPDALRGMASVIHDKEQVVFYMPGSSVVISALQQNLFIAGTKAISVTSMHEMLNCTDHLDSNCVVFVKTLDFPETQDLTPVFKKLKANGVGIYYLGTPKTRYSSYIDRYIMADLTGRDFINTVLSNDVYFYALNEVFRRAYID